MTKQEIEELKASIISLESALTGPNEYTRPSVTTAILSLCRAVHRLCDLLEPRDEAPKFNILPAPGVTLDESKFSKKKKQ